MSCRVRAAACSQPTAEPGSRGCRGQNRSTLKRQGKEKNRFRSALRLRSTPEDRQIQSRQKEQDRGGVVQVRRAPAEVRSRCRKESQNCNILSMWLPAEDSPVAKS